jgi:hypothetical protein
MGFASGSVTFRRFAVVGQQPKRIEQEMLDKLSEHALRPGDVGVPEDVEYGWSGGRHVLDANFSFEHNVFNDCISCGMRVDTNKVPSSLVKAYQIIEEESVAAGNPSGFNSKQQKKEVKETIRKKVEHDLRSGRFRRSKLVPLLWDLPSGTIYTAAAGSAQEQLMELFERTFSLQLAPLTAGSLAMRMLEPRGRRRDYEDFRPSRFVHGPGGESEWPQYPWAAKGPEPKDFLGDEFLLWLWHEADAKTGVIGTEQSGPVAGADVTVYLDKSLDLDCAYGQSGKDSLRGAGPSHMPEAKDALRSGKVPRKAGTVLVLNNQQFEFTWNPELMALGSSKLPDVEEAETPRVLFEERIALLRELCKATDALFDTFLRSRASSAWESHTNAIRKWIMHPPKSAAA